LEYKLKELKKQKNVKILSEIPTDVTKFPLRTDRFRLSQIFSKLISNAIKFTEKGFIRIGFTKGKKGRIQFFIEDSGIGIQPDYIPYIFMRFTKIDKPNEKLYRGMGMGLTIAQNIVQLLGGEIFIDSQPTKGSRFYFEIPCLMNLPNPNINPSKTKKMKLPQYDWSRKTILIAEDVESNFLFLDEVIKKTGATILWATNGEKAIDLFKKHKIDLILMDIQMPVMNGFEATRIIKKINPSIPIISQTAYAMAEDRDKSLEAGCDDYISKPIPTIKLLNLLANYINIRVEEK
jgi:CheY-like chemotaxis protein